MSDPVTNMQIEDVLSSIRKLVSEEVRAQTRPNKASEPLRKSDKLILTPAQRVPEEDDAEAESDYAGPEAGSDFDMDAFSRDLLTEDAAPEAETFEPEAPVAAEEPLFRHGRSGRVVAGQSLSSLAAEGGFEDEGANAGTPLELSVFAEEAADEFAFEDDAHDDLILQDVAPEPESEASVATIPSFLRSRGVNSMNTRIAAVPPAPEPESLSWEDHLDADMPEAAALPATPEEIDGDVWAEAGAPDEEAEQGLMIDEEILRDMVSEIVRQELQGALGERITRNVRKLVRREIQRALTAHDLL